MAERQKSVCLLSLIGIPASGKTFFAQKLISLASETICCLLVTYDDLIPVEDQAKMALIADRRTEEKRWKKARKGVFEAVSHIAKGGMEQDGHAAAIMATKRGQNDSNRLLIILDDNNYYKSMRYEYYQLARETQAGFCQIFFEVSLEEAFKANRRRKVEIPAKVIEDMLLKLEIPQPSHNPWEKYSLTVRGLSSEDRPLSANALSLVETAFEDPVRPLEPEVNPEEKDLSRRICDANVMHQCDKALRKAVGNVLAKSDNPKKLKVKVQDAKGHVLEDLQSGYSRLSDDLIHKIANNDDNVTIDLENAITSLLLNKLSSM